MTVVIVMVGTVAVVTVVIGTYFSKNNLTHWQPMRCSQGSVLRFLRCFIVICEIKALCISALASISSNQRWWNYQGSSWIIMWLFQASEGIWAQKLINMVEVMNTDLGILPESEENEYNAEQEEAKKNNCKGKGFLFLDICPQIPSIPRI